MNTVIGDLNLNLKKKKKIISIICDKKGNIRKNWFELKNKRKYEDEREEDTPNVNVNTL